MKWKKIFPIISFGAVIGAASSNLISVNVGDQNGYAFLSSLKDFDWKNKTFGDGIEYNNNSEASEDISSVINSFKKEPKVINSINKGRFLDYSNYSTGFQSNDCIAKQAVTGVPINGGFMPNGNYVSDFGITSKAQRYSTMNSVLNWSSENDKDARYNRSYVPLRKSVPSAFIYPNKNRDINFSLLRHSTRVPMTFDNSSVGVKNPFEGTNLNWAYVSSFVNWAGSTSIGIIVAPPGDMIDMAHNNGTPIYGNVFLDGYHGLSKQMIRDFVAKDKNGNYLIVDFLINLADYYGFDGWFFNDESNGVNPNGTVLDRQIVIDIIKQFNKKVFERNDNKKIIYYGSDSSLAWKDGQYVNKEAYEATKTMPNGEPIDVQLNFGVTPDSSSHFINSNSNYKGHENKLFSLVDTEWNRYIFGTFDWRQQAYAYKYDGKSMSYKNGKDDIYSSVSGFMDDGSAAFGSASLDLLKKHSDRDYLFAVQTSNLYNDIFFNGLNTNPSINDEGYNMTSVHNDYKTKSGSRPENVEKEFINKDPRVQFDGKNKDEKNETSDFISQKIYNYDSNSGLNSNSYGVSNLVQEKTVFEDNDGNNPDIKTNFSIGSGIKFVDRQNGKISEQLNYPFTNRRLADVLPTYQWDIDEVPNGTLISDINPAADKSSTKTIKPKITELNGFYDFDDVYKKTNSIALGSSFDQEGRVNGGVWDEKSKYIWNIFGTNISSNDKHEFSITYKSNAKNGLNDGDVSPILTLTNQSSGVSKYVVLSGTNVKTVSTSDDNWKTIKFNLDGLDINADNRLSRIGLLINPNGQSDFKFNVGEFTMDHNNKNDNNNVQKALVNMVSEYRIQRNNMVNIRFNYEKDKNINADYLEFYIKNKNGKWYRVGETTADEYYIKEINSEDFGETIDLVAISFKDDKVVGCDEYEIN